MCSTLLPERHSPPRTTLIPVGFLLVRLVGFLLVRLESRGTRLRMSFSTLQER